MLDNSEFYIETDKKNINHFLKVLYASFRAKQLENTGMPYQKKFSIIALNEIDKGLDIEQLRESIIHSMQKNYKPPVLEIIEAEDQLLEDLSITADDYVHHSQELELSEEETVEMDKLESDEVLKV